MGTSIFSRRFDAAGVAQGSPFLVNTTTTGNQSDPAVSMDADGNFVVVWTSSGQDGTGDVTRSRSTATSAMSMGIAR